MRQYKLCAAACGCAGHPTQCELEQLQVIEHPGLVDITLGRAVKSEDHERSFPRAESLGRAESCCRHTLKLVPGCLFSKSSLTTILTPLAASVRSVVIRRVWIVLRYEVNRSASRNQLFPLD